MMSRHIARYLIMLLSVLVLLQATILTAASQPLPSFSLATAFARPEPSWPPEVPSAKKGCVKMEASDSALWFDVDENGDPDLDTVVDSYPSDVVAIVAGFEYNCIPAKTTVAVIFYALDQGGDKPWYTNEVKLAPTDKPGILWRGVRFKDRRPIPDGHYRVEFFSGKRLLTAGEVTVGSPEEPEKEGEPESTLEQEATQEDQKEQAQERKAERQRDDKVQIEGKIIDGSTQKPIRGAVFIVLNPGVTAAQWADFGYPPSDIMTVNRTDSTGRFRQSGVERGVEYSVIAWALSYAPWYHDGFILGDRDSDPYPLTIELYR